MVVRRHLPALLVVLGLALALVHPVLGDPTTLALGDERNDVWNHVWGYAWVAERVAAGELPLHAESLAWPRGGTLWFIDLFGALATLPVQWAAGPVAAYNAALFGNWVLCGLGAYALGLQVSGSRSAGTVAGVAFMATPQLLGQATNGISETLAAGGLPLALLALRWAWERPGWRRGVAVGAAFALCALANWYYGLFAAMVALALALRAPFLRAFRWRGALELHAAAALVGGALVLPALGLFLSSISADDALVRRDATFNWSTLVLHNMTDVLALVHPGKFYSPDLLESFGEHLIVVVSLGHAALWPAVAALALGWREARWWGAMALGFTVLTLGPYLYVGGDYLQVNGGWVPLPFLFLFEHAPGFSTISHPYRFAVGVGLALSVLMALCARELTRRGLPAVPVALALGGARVAETLWGTAAVFPIPVARAEIPPVYGALEGGAVWDLPIGIGVLERSRYGLYQLAHRQPIPYGLNDHVPLLLWSNRFSRTLIEMEWSDVATLPATLPWLDIELGRRALVDDGLRWIVLHERDYASHQLPRVEGFLDLVAEPVFDDDELRIYRLD